MKILALDTATRTGWAVLASGIVTSGAFDCHIRTQPTLCLPKDHAGKRFHLFRTQLMELIHVNRPDLIVYEAVVGGRSAGGNTSMIQKGLEAILHMEAYHSFGGHDPIPVWSFAAATIKKWATGNGQLTHESKVEMMRLAFETFKDQEFIQTAKGLDDNQCDALWILDLARAVVAYADCKVQDDCLRPSVINSLTSMAGHVIKSKWGR